jgi:hypothetical protein
MMESAASPPKRVQWTMKRGGDGAAVEMARRPKAQAISGTARVSWALSEKDHAQNKPE